MNNISRCPECGGALKYYDKVTRIIRAEGGRTHRVSIQRVRCVACRRLHRVLPDYIVPYKQYYAEIINGVTEGIITPETIGFEDYPHEVTMFRWMKGKENNGP